MRVIVIALVITTHVVATGSFYNSTASGAVWMLSHTSRNIFFIISALVLAYVYAPRPSFNIVSFYWRRFKFVLPPYIAWTFIYMVQNHDYRLGAPHFFHLFVYNLLTARAMYHLYFLLVIMQLYLLFPLIHRALPWIRRHRRTVLTASFLLQIAICIVVLTQFHGTPRYGWWFDHPEYILFSHQFYIVLGLVIATDLGRFNELLDRFKRWWLPLAALTCGLGEAIYMVAVHASVRPDLAAAEFHPYQVIECIAVTMLLCSLGRRWVQAGARNSAAVKTLSNDSFGVYLSHLFVLYWLMTFQPVGRSWQIVLSAAVLGTIVVYALSVGLVELLRLTFLSTVLTGQPAVLPLRRINAKFRHYAFNIAKQRVPQRLRAWH